MYIYKDLTIQEFNQADLPAVRTFVEKTWSRPKSDDFYRWRYLDCPNAIGLLAKHRGEVLAMLWAFRQTYLLKGTKTECLELVDWATLPEWTKTGVGVLLMKKIMERPEPLIVVGGSQDTQNLLPRLNWRKLGDVNGFLLPLGGKRIGKHIGNRLKGLKWPFQTFHSVFLKPWFKIQKKGRPAGIQVEKKEKMGYEVARLYQNRRDDISIPSCDTINWLLKAPSEMGIYQLLHFSFDDQLKGWSLTRMRETALGPEVSILDVFMTEELRGHLPWVVDEVVLNVPGAELDTIVAATNSKALCHAFRKNRFLPYKEFPFMMWRKEKSADLVIPTVGNNTSDIPLLPYPQPFD